MKVLFVHDHKFRKINDVLYSPGGLPNDILSRYTKWFGEVEVIGRIIEEYKTKDTYSRIINDKIHINNKSELRKKVQDADVIIARLPSINGYKAILWARMFRKPFMVEVVGCAFDSYWNYSLFGKIVAVPAYLIMRRCVSVSPYTLYVTHRFLEKRYPSHGEQAAISDVSLANFNEEIIKKRLDKIKNMTGKITLGTAAAVDIHYKGQEYVIRAIPIIEKRLGVSIEYQLAGAGNTSYLKKIAEESGVRDKIIFKGIIPHKEIFNWFDDLDIYVHPSMFEGLSRAIIEAMSRGLPCVAADRGGNGELLEKANLYFVGNKRRISEKISRVVSHMLLTDGEMEKNAVRNYNYVNNFYDDQRLTEQRNKFYSEFRESIVGNCE